MKSFADELETVIRRELLRWDGIEGLGAGTATMIADSMRTRVLGLLTRRGINGEGFKQPIQTVDVVMFTMIDGNLHVLLPKRGPEPAEFEGMPGLVGGYIHTQEDADTYAAARRVCLTKIKMDVSHLEQLAMFSGPDRDPRGWSSTMVYIAMVRSSDLTAALMDEFHPVDSLAWKRIAFDHKKIIGWAVKRIRNKASYSTLPLFLMGAEFTIGELQQVYEALLGYPVDQAKFRRTIKNLIEPIGMRFVANGRPSVGRRAQLYTAKQRDIGFFDETIPAIDVSQ